MANFASIAKGIRARHIVDLPLADGVVTKVSVRALTDAEDDEIETEALAYAKTRKVEDPKAGDPIYDRGVAVHTLLLACSDPDSPDASPVPFFSDVEEIQHGLDRDRIAWLLSAQQIWQDKCSPRQLNLSPDEFVERITEVAVSKDEGPFLRMRPGLQWICMRILAVQWWNSPGPKSLFGLDDATASSNSESKPNALDS